MSAAKAWHEAMIRQLHDLAATDPAVEGLAVVGSGAQGRLDAWSDLDALLIVRPEAFDRFFPALVWLEPLGRVYAYRATPRRVLRRLAGSASTTYAASI